MKSRGRSKVELGKNRVSTQEDNWQNSRRTADEQGKIWKEQRNQTGKGITDVEQGKTDIHIRKQDIHIRKQEYQYTYLVILIDCTTD